MLFKSIPKDSVLVQYIDDGIVMHGPNGNRETESSFWDWTQRSLYTQQTGLAFNHDKTETIMLDGKLLKPIKFLGCSYDGETFSAYTRNKGLVTIPNAKEKILEVIEWLKENGKYLNSYSLNKLIAEGWNFEEERWYTVPMERFTDPSGLTGQSSTWWKETKMKIVRLRVNSIEALTYKMLKMNNEEWLMNTTNTSTMMCTAYLLSMKEPGTKITRKQG
jgi:hypothetical protein